MIQSEKQLSGRVLIVDDNPKNLQVLGKFLRNENYELEFAVDGNAALEWLDIKEFDLVLLDVNMPGLDGFEVCKRIRANPNLDRMPVFFLTAETLRDSVLKGFEIGAQDYITKPFDSRELIMRVKTHISLRRHMDYLEQLNRTLEERISERTRDLQAAKEKAEESDRLKTAFLMNISHEIRTPLNGIMGSLMLLEDETLDSNRKKEYIEMATLSGQRLLDTLRDIFEISSIESGDYVISKSLVRSDNFLREQFLRYRSQAEEKGLKMTIGPMEQGEEAVIQTDSLKVGRILEILLKNAIKFTRRGSIEIGSFREDNSLVIYIKDTGIGIPDNKSDAIFKRFVQADMGLRRDHEGTGLGLAIVKAYIDILGGRVWFTSEVGKGSVFSFSLPG